jgi:hypothetical protein
MAHVHSLADDLLDSVRNRGDLYSLELRDQFLVRKRLRSCSIGLSVRETNMDSRCRNQDQSRKSDYDNARFPMMLR